MRFDNSFFSERIICTDTERSECLDTVKEVVRAYETTRKYGVLALIDFTSDNAFLLDCKEYLTSGFWGAELSEIYEKLILAGNYRGKEFLQNVIIAEGFTAITEVSESFPLIRVIPPLFGIGWGNRVTETILMERELCRNEEQTT